MSDNERFDGRHELKLLQLVPAVAFFLHKIHKALRLKLSDLPKY